MMISMIEMSGKVRMVSIVAATMVSTRGLRSDDAAVTSDRAEKH